MDLRSLQIFIEVAELNSFTQAGERLGYSQPTISFQIRQLEQELGIPLFDRIGHTVSLTDAGRAASGLSWAPRKPAWPRAHRAGLASPEVQAVTGSGA